jgi:N-acetylglucosaminyldiphosphoundecaprenol N-acetyl-beta-D-mannosaminyltransferase
VVPHDDGDMTVRARHHILGLPVDPLTMDETIYEIGRRIDEGRPSAHTSLNAANLVTARDDAEFASDLEAADFVSPDGQSVVWSGRLLGVPIPERVTGIDLMYALIRESPVRGWRVYLVGAHERVVAEVARRLTVAGVDVVGFRDGYFPAAEDEHVAAAVAAADAQLLFVGMPSPRKERFIVGAARPAGIPCSVGVGGTFDVLAGRVRRAPPLAQRWGLEWLYRLAQEPRRLLWRYTIDNGRFVVLVARELLARRRSP